MELKTHQEKNKHGYILFTNCVSTKWVLFSDCSHSTRIRQEIHDHT